MSNIGDLPIPAPLPSGTGPDLTLIFQEATATAMKVLYFGRNGMRGHFHSICSQAQINEFGVQLTKKATDLLDQATLLDCTLTELQARLAQPDGLPVYGYTTAFSVFQTEKGEAWPLETVHTVLRQPAIPGHPIVEIVSDNIFVQWESLYDNSDSPAKGSGLRDLTAPFWGIQYGINHKSDADFTLKPNGRKPQQVPIIGVLVDRSETFARDELAYFQQLNAEGRIRLSVFPPDNAVIEDDLFFEAFKTFVTQPMDALHLACHGSPDERMPLDSYLTCCGTINKSDQKRIKLHNLMRLSPLDINLVVMNACSMDARGAKGTFDFVGTMKQKGAQNVVAIETSVSSCVAKDFAKLLFDKLLAGESLGIALLDTRKQLAEQPTAPYQIAGLFYTLFGDFDFKLLSS